MKDKQELKDLFGKVQELTGLIAKQQSEIIDAQGKILNLLYSEEKAVIEKSKAVNPEEGD